MQAELTVDQATTCLRAAAALDAQLVRSWYQKVIAKKQVRHMHLKMGKSTRWGFARLAGCWRDEDGAPSLLDAPLV